jgi:mannose-1-phosphate guanylyltransferase/mannose-6-phosphate isomerase
MHKKIISFVLAGGSGTRLAPLSLALPGKLPKQFLPLLSDKTMLQETLDRLPDGVEKVVICAEKYEDEVKKQVGENVSVISEPFPCNTAMAIGLAAIYAKKMSGDEDTIIFFNPSDHHVNTEYFRKYYGFMIDAAENGKIVTMGITPDRPETGLGYIKIKNQKTNKSINQNSNTVEIEAFVEKPDLEKAKRFVDSGEYFWNSGMFCFTIKTILEKLEKHSPVIYNALIEIEKGLGTEKEKEAIFKGFTDVKEQKANISIDFAVMEKEAENILLVKADKELEWDDIGLWIALKKYFPKDKDDNVVRGEAQFEECKNNLVLNYDKNIKISLAKINSHLLVNTRNGILVCPQDSAIRASEIVPELEANKKEILIDCDNIKIKNATEIPVSCIGCQNLEINLSEKEISVKIP